MKLKRLCLIITLVLICTIIMKAGDRESIQTSVKTTIDAFNKQDYNTYFSLFVDDKPEFLNIVSPPLYDAACWKNFIERMENAASVSCHQQDVKIRIYNGNTALATACCTFNWMERGGILNSQSARASMLLVKKYGKWYTVNMHFSRIPRSEG